MRLFHLACVFFILVGAGSVRAQEAVAGDIPAAVFAELPAINYPVVSPDGRFIAFSHNRGDERFIFSVNMETGERQLVNALDNRVEGLYWVGNRYVLMRLGAPGGLAFVPGVVDFAQMMALDMETQNLRLLVQQTNDMGYNADLAQVIGLDEERGRVLIEAYSRTRTLDVYWVFLHNGGFQTAMEGQDNTRGWILNADNEPTIRIDQRGDEDQLVYVRTGREAFRPLSLDEDEPELRGVYGLDVTGRNLIAREARSGVVSAVVAVPLDGTSPRQTLFESSEYDVAGVITDSYTNAVLGIEWADTHVRTEWFDEEFRDLQSRLEASLAAEVVTIVSWSQDRRVAVIRAQYGDRPDAFFIYRTDANGESWLENLMSENPALAEASLPYRESISYTARDGTDIPAYLTLPDGDGPFPFVVLPHGGPAARDYGGYDMFAHFLASRGYGVIQPNFRGSAGYGLRWREAGHGEWGIGVMQHDVSDAVSVLVEEGLADPERICILGGSYGGYAALAGAAFTPDLYSCAISFNGVSNLSRMLRYTRDRYGDRSTPYLYWHRSILDDDDTREQTYLDQRSPEENAASIRVPVLLIHGRSDSVVDVEQSRRMRSAIEREGGTVRYVQQEGGDHWLTGYSVRREVLEEVERFLIEVLGDPDG